jgi:hypothetical protein
LSHPRVFSPQKNGKKQQNVLQQGIKSIAAEDKNHDFIAIGCDESQKRVSRRQRQWREKSTVWFDYEYVFVLASKEICG